MFEQISLLHVFQHNLTVQKQQKTKKNIIVNNVRKPIAACERNTTFSTDTHSTIQSVSLRDSNHVVDFRRVMFKVKA